MNNTTSRTYTVLGAYSIDGERYEVRLIDGARVVYYTNNGREFVAWSESDTDPKMWANLMLMAKVS